MSIRIAIPEPASPQFVEDAIAYNQRSLPQYLHALHSAGATPILVPLHETQDRVAKILATCQGILLPGSGADVDPQKYGQLPIAACGSPDPARAAVDELLIQDAFNLHKPILAICHGAQTLNVWCGGTLTQDIPTQTDSQVNHAPGRTILEAHEAAITPNTQLARLVPPAAEAPTHADPVEPFRLPHPHHTEPAKHDRAGDLWVNSSHHQAVATPGDNLRIAAICPQDGVIEAVELDSREHWVLAIQWHPERSYNESQFSRNIFQNFIQTATTYTPRKIEASILA